MGIPVEQLITIRKEKLAKIAALGFNPSPTSYQPENKIKESKKLICRSMWPAESGGYRRHGKLCFLELADQTGKIQVMARLTESQKKLMKWSNY